MADKVHFHLEEYVPLFKQYEEKEIFSPTELKQIVKKITEHEYKINRKIVLLQDFINYIQYQKQVLSLVQKRKKRQKFDIKEWEIIKFINALYKKAILKFKSNIALIVDFIQFLKQHKNTKLLAQYFAKAIQLHPTKALFWIMAAEYEFTVLNNIMSARILLQRGIRVNPYDQELWIEYFKLELLWVEKLDKRNKLLFKKEEIKTKKRKADESGLEDEEFTAIVADINVKETNFEFEFEKSINELLIPKAVYKNAIKSKTFLISNSR